MDITQVKEGKKYKVVEIQGGYELVKKLDDLGIRTGVDITKIRSEFAKGPIIVQIGNTQIAIGFGMAKKIIVEQEK